MSIMEPKWELSEPNIESAMRKNTDGICAMGKCNNQLSDPPSHGPFGVKICDECRKPIDEMLKEVRTLP